MSSYLRLVQRKWCIAQDIRLVSKYWNKNGFTMVTSKKSDPRTANQSSRGGSGPRPRRRRRANSAVGQAKQYRRRTLQCRGVTLSWRAARRAAMPPRAAPTRAFIASAASDASGRPVCHNNVTFIFTISYTNVIIQQQRRKNIMWFDSVYFT